MSADPNHIPPIADERFNKLEQGMADTQQQIAEVLKQNKEIRELLSQLTPTNVRATPTEKTDSSPSSELIPSFVSRRSMLKKAALATLGAVAVWETMPSARAASGGDMILGTSNSASSSSTGLTASTSSAALSVMNSGSGYGVYAYSSSSSNAGVSGSSRYAPGVSGSSIYVPGVSGTSTSGYGVYGNGGKYGAGLDGGLAPLYLFASTLNNPYSDTQTHFAGELYVDSLNELWYCTVGGTPGTWRKIAGSATAGSFALLPAPTRFIDTRTAGESTSSTGTAPPAPGGGVTTYTFSGTNALTPYSSGGTPPSIPFGATGLVGRLTVLSGQNGHTAVTGELKVSNVNPPGFGSGLILWGAGSSTQILPFVLALDNSSGDAGKMYFVNTSAADVIDLIVDVTGYYY